MKTYPGSEFPYKKAQQTERRKGTSLARSADGFLGLGRPGLVLEPLIQGNVNQSLPHANEQLTLLTRPPLTVRNEVKGAWQARL